MCRLYLTWPPAAHLVVARPQARARGPGVPPAQEHAQPGGEVVGELRWDSTQKFESHKTFKLDIDDIP